MLYVIMFLFDVIISIFICWGIDKIKYLNGGM